MQPARFPRGQTGRTVRRPSPAQSCSPAGAPRSPSRARLGIGWQETAATRRRGVAGRRPPRRRGSRARLGAWLRRPSSSRFHMGPGRTGNPPQGAPRGARRRARAGSRRRQRRVAVRLVPPTARFRGASGCPERRTGPSPGRSLLPLHRALPRGKAMPPRRWPQSAGGLPVLGEAWSCSRLQSRRLRLGVSSGRRARMAWTAHSDPGRQLSAGRAARPARGDLRLSCWARL